MSNFKFIPVKKFSYTINGNDEIDLSDTTRWGDKIGGGIFQNTGTNDVTIDQTYTLTPGQTFTISVQYPYIDKSSYRINFGVGGRGSGTNSLGVTLFRIFDDAGNSDK